MSIDFYCQFKTLIEPMTAFSPLKPHAFWKQGLLFIKLFRKGLLLLWQRDQLRNVHSNECKQKPPS